MHWTVRLGCEDGRNSHYYKEGKTGGARSADIGEYWVGQVIWRAHFKPRGATA